MIRYIKKKLKQFTCHHDYNGKLIDCYYKNEKDKAKGIGTHKVNYTCSKCGDVLKMKYRFDI